MKKFFLTLGVALFAVQVDAQYGSVELSSGGFSFIPDFTSRDPHIILSAGTGTGKRLSAHFLSLIRTDNLTPRNAIFITRYQLIDRRFKLSIGTHLPGLQITDDFTVDSFFGQEVLTNYRINDKWSLRSMYLHGKGRNLDLEMNFFTAGAAYAKGKLNTYSQFWILDLDNAFGFSQSVGYQLAPHYSLRLFANQTLTGEKDFIATIGLNRSF
ncbi:MAG: hypothetical protein ACO3L1_01730 [Flavobacteriaceae bacterium]|jgi:hypothetical protein